MEIRVVCSDVQEPEGPVCTPGGQIYIVEMAKSRACVSRVGDDGHRHPVAYPHGRPNGMAIDGDGNFWIAGGEEEKLVVMSPQGQELKVYGGPEGMPYLWPNDLVFGANGLLYMTDSGIHPDDFIQGQAIRKDFRTCAYNGKVFEIDPRSGTVLRVLDTGLRFANGIAFDAHDRLYVNETITGKVYRYDLSTQGTPQRERFGNVIDGAPESFVGPDGMAFGADGRLYCAVFGQGNVTVLGKDGQVEARLPTRGERPTNIAFLEDGRSGAVVTMFDTGCVEHWALPCIGRALYRPRMM